MAVSRCVGAVEECGALEVSSISWYLHFHSWSTIVAGSFQKEIDEWCFKSKDD